MICFTDSEVKFRGGIVLMKTYTFGIRNIGGQYARMSADN